MWEHSVIPFPLRMACVSLSSFRPICFSQNPLEMIEVKQIQHSSRRRAGYAWPYIWWPSLPPPVYCQISPRYENKMTTPGLIFVQYGPRHRMLIQYLVSEIVSYFSAQVLRIVSRSKKIESLLKPLFTFNQSCIFITPESKSRGVLRSRGKTITQSLGNSFGLANLWGSFYLIANACGPSIAWRCLIENETDLTKWDFVSLCKRGGGWRRGQTNFGTKSIFSHWRLTGKVQLCVLPNENLRNLSNRS